MRTVLQGLRAAALLAVCTLGLGSGIAQAATVPVTADITTSTTWTANNEYILTDVIYVTSGATLTIEPGTVIRGEPDADGTPSTADAGNLVITRGSKIRALGTEQNPIVFTDLVDDNVGTNPGTFPYNSRVDLPGTTGKWGGLVLLGRGYVANNTLSGPSAARENQIEGLTAVAEKGFYGGCAEYPAEFNPTLDPSSCDDDDSGTVRYVSLRYGGILLSANNEINGITFGGVGRNTDLDFIEVFQNKDDCSEYFGGAVYLKHLVCYAASDDNIDWDEGYRGKIQYALIVQGDNGGADKSDKGMEMDSGISPDGSQPVAIPTVYNVTMIGLGGAASQSYTGKALNTAGHFRDNSGGRIYNSFFADFGGNPACIEGANAGGSPTGAITSGERAITAYVPDGEIYQGPPSAFQLEAQDNSYWCFGGGGVLPSTSAAGAAAGCDSGKEYYDNGWFSNASLQNTYGDCTATLPIRSLTRQAVGLGAGRPNPVNQIDPRPAAGSVLLTTDRTAPADGFFDPVSYRGAFSSDNNGNWAQGWTLMSRLGFFPPRPVVNVVGDITTSTTWTADKEYVLTDVIYVTSGATLTIEAGTVIRGEPDADGTPSTADAGNLVITRGSKIRALGTAENPIVFTDLTDDYIKGYPGVTFPYYSRVDLPGTTGKWGGLVLLGRGYVANNTLSGPSAARENQIEGLTAVAEKGFYGGCAEYPAEFNPTLDPSSCDDDDSGTVQYIQLRYGGILLSANNEINGITFGGVGRNTDLDYIEVMQNKDDCSEYFGGAVYLKHLVCVAASDDNIDWDEGYRGKIQYALIMQGDNGGADKSDKGMEMDSGISPDGSQPVAIPTVYNVTMIGLGGDASASYTGKALNTAGHFRDNSGGRIYNSFFADFGGNPACIEGANAGGSPTGAITSGERAITAYAPDGEIYQGPASAFQLEAQNDSYWCFGGGGVLPSTSAAGAAAGCDSGKEYYDNGWFSNAGLKNSYAACNTPLPIRALTRQAAGLGAGRPLPINQIDPRPAVGSSLLTTDRQAPADGFFTPSNYRGAFPAGSNWAQGWTVASRLGYFPGCSAGVGAAPGEASNLRFIGKTILAWQAPNDGLSVNFDLLRSATASNFSAATCVAKNEYDRQATDLAVPAVGAANFYLVRVKNTCGDTLGTQSNGTARTGVVCP
ncbi:MAG: hypothetical protein U0V87_17670 [Acidobacteriota bacterium]